MSDRPRAKPASRRRWFLVALVALPVVLIIGRLAWLRHLSDPSGQITIGRETTYLDGPLTRDGAIDYVAAVNQRESEGVTPENNAVVLLVQAYGPELISEAGRGRYLELLGGPPPADGERFLNERMFFQESLGGRDAIIAEQEFMDSRESASQRAWTRDEFPDVAALLDRNAAPLALIVAASRRERYYSPLVSGSQIPMLMMVLLPIEQEQREAARQLTARAMLKLGEGDAAGAWDDLLACHRLARLTGESPLIIGGLVAIAMDALAFEADQALLASPLLTADQARECLAELRSLRPLPSMAEVVDQTERLVGLDIAMISRRLAGVGVIENAAGSSSILRGGIDWNIVLRMINDEFDRMVDDLRQPADTARMSLLRRQQAELIHARHGSRGALTSLKVRAFLGEREAVSRDYGEMLLAHYMPAVLQTSIAETRAAARERLLLAGFALAAYQRAGREYPESLAALVPDVLSDVPVDPWSGQELIYRRTEDGYVVYSVGDNLNDDGGMTSASRTPGAPGDIVVRVGGK